MDDLRETLHFMGKQTGFLQLFTLPSGKQTELLKMSIYREFTHKKWWFSIVMLVYQRVSNQIQPKSSAIMPRDLSLWFAWTPFGLPSIPTWTMPRSLRRPIFNSRRRLSVEAAVFCRYSAQDAALRGRQRIVSKNNNLYWGLWGIM